jgi:uncharacterized protein
MSPDVQPSRGPRRRRGPVRRYLETRGVIGRHTAAHLHTRLRAEDGTALAATYLAGPGRSDVAVLVVHGFAANRRKPAYARLADGLAARFPVLALDLRGHGGSAGRSTWGDAEAQDVAAGIAWLVRFGHPRVVVVGVSMGATATLHAVWRGAPVAAIVTVSAPARFRSPAETAPLRRLEALWHSPAQRGALRALLGVTLAAPELWSSPPHPVEMAGSVQQPWLVVHGEDDAYFPLSDARALVASAAGPAVLWAEPAGFGHAEDGLGPAFVQALTAAIVEVATTDRFPERAPHP